MNWLIGLRDWVDARLPIVRAWDTHMAKYYAPKNFNLWFFFGVLSLLVLVNQLLENVEGAVVGGEGGERLKRVGRRALQEDEGVGL